MVLVRLDLLALLINCVVAVTAVLAAILVLGKEAALAVWALLTLGFDRAILSDLEELKDFQLLFLALVWDTLLGDEVLFLPLLLLATIINFEFFEDGVLSNGTSKLEACESLELFERKARRNLKCEELSSECSNENLH